VTSSNKGAHFPVSSPGRWQALPSDVLFILRTTDATLFFMTVTGLEDSLKGAADAARENSLDDSRDADDDNDDNDVENDDFVDDGDFKVGWDDGTNGASRAFLGGIWFAKMSS
jgi:hypothetical protein